MGYETLARVTLANLPTPLEEAKRLREAIGGPRLFIKRDDLTGLGMGGNKLRKLEFLLGDALAKKADVVITSGAIQTNHGRLTAAACAKLGLECRLVLTERDAGYYEGNRILQHLFGARQFFCDIDDSVPPEKLDREKLRAGDAKTAELVEEVRASGRVPYVIPRGGRSLWGTAGYCGAMAELKKQLDDMNVKADHIIVPCATGSTLTGTLLGCRVASIDAKIHGIALSRSVEEGRRMVEEEFNKDSEGMGYPYRITQDGIDLRSGMGRGYAIPTAGGQDAIKLLARTEGILLDPVYTGKTMAGYIDMVKHGAFRADESV
ncbi:MAG: D-cysteine desulfhydrase family protein, partial [Synergistaceae bacterium]|nr:D-cysteine desulfhydrase family protein [Synergistaceae bacterium]